jgi:raffinose/stachyose/melibiose transport system permease protein
MSATSTAAARAGATHPPTSGPPPAVRANGRRVDRTYYLFLLPALVLFTALITLPAIVGAVTSLTNYVGYGDWTFVGLANFSALFSDPRILSSYGFTIGFALATVVVVNMLALMLAIGLNAKIHFSTALRGVFFLPMVLSGIVIAYVFSFLFSNSLPAMASAVGLGPLETSILASPDTAWLGIVIVTAWQAIPSSVIIYLAGLQAVPEEVYEAASLDGANSRRQFWAITLPLMGGYVVLNTVLCFKNFINSYDVIVGLTNGGPGTATTSVAMSIFTGFTSGDYAYQMANAVVLFVVAVLVAALQLQLIKRRGVSL